MNGFLKGKDVVLASNSPRRKELMSLLCQSFRVVPSNAEEVISEEISKGFTDKAAQTARYLACLKAEDVAKSNVDSVVFGCDTVVSVDDEILGKPKDDDEAFCMLKKLSGRTHRVLSGVCICYKERKISFFCETLVHFRELSEEEIRDYVKSGDPRDKAGAYGIPSGGAMFWRGVTCDLLNGE